MTKAISSSKSTIVDNHKKIVNGSVTIDTSSIKLISSNNPMEPSHEPFHEGSQHVLNVAKDNREEHDNFHNENQHRYSRPYDILQCDGTDIVSEESPNDSFNSDDSEAEAN